ncbi:hypothetical protein DFH28DRAFT_889923 [Melampsora americana]|nr:hypothetical protein DFH28DRAFT_889923 [Melampsora americana]
MNKRFSTSTKLLQESARKLLALRRNNETYTEAYLEAQWNQQRECQLRAIVDESPNVLAKKLTRLAELEERHAETEWELQAIHAKERRNRTASERRKLAVLPGTIQLIEDDIDELVVELGGHHYRDMPGRNTPKGKLLIRIRVSKSKLYGARVDVFEVQRRNDEREGAWSN